MYRRCGHHLGGSTATNAQRNTRDACVVIYTRVRTSYDDGDSKRRRAEKGPFCSTFPTLKGCVSVCRASIVIVWSVVGRMGFCAQSVENGSERTISFYGGVSTTTMITTRRQRARTHVPGSYLGTSPRCCPMPRTNHTICSRVSHSPMYGVVYLLAPTM